MLLGFFKDVNRPNLRINFDPANLIMYGTDNPLEAIGILAPHVVSVHAKDGDWPDKSVPGSLGVEKQLGQGSVDIPRFVARLKGLGYKGTLNIEREIEDQVQRRKDVAESVVYLRGLIG